jgi:site-specific recombinase XerD
VQQAKRSGAMDYAIAYLLFAAGLQPEELICLHRDDYWAEDKAGILRVGKGSLSQRTVPVNQKILGHRYGSANNNPLTAYLKNRKDTHANMFVDSNSHPLSLAYLQQHWLQWLLENRKLDRNPIEIHQARQTWGVEMLMRGMDVENFRIISGLKPLEIQLYQQRVKEKAAVNQAIALDA